VRFRGAVVESRWEKNWPFNWCDVSPREVAFGPGVVRPAVHVPRRDLTSVAVEKVRLPLTWKTIVWFRWRTTEGEEARIGFDAWSRRAFVRALQDCGLDVEGA
jgi:hypothetical protein